MKQIDSLRTTNTIIYGLSLIGAFFVLFLGARTCVEYCEYSNLAEYLINVEITAFAVAAVLFSTLIFQVVNVFALHVEKSHGK